MSEPRLSTRSSRIVPWELPAPGRMLAIAHRAGNDIRLLRTAVEHGADLIEADIWPHRGRLEVRHLKTMKFLPLLWDRWKLAPGWTTRLQLKKLLEESGEASLMLDLKGHDVEEADNVRELISEVQPEKHVVICARAWGLLEPFRPFPWAHVVHSVGREYELAALWPLIDGGEVRGISIHERLLSEERVRRIRANVPLLMSWPLNSTARTEQLRAWGVNGAITDSLHVLREVAEAGRTLPDEPATSGGSEAAPRS